MIDLEKQILGEILLLPTREKQLEVFDDLGASDFTTAKYRTLAEKMAMILLAEKQRVDTVNLFQRTRDINFPPQEIMDLSTDILSTEPLKHHIQLLKENNFQRNLLNTTKLGAEGLQGAVGLEEITEQRDKLIADLSGMDIRNQSTFADLNAEKAKIIEDLRSKKELEGYSWGIVDLDRSTGGMATPGMTLLGGLKKAGKTRFCINTMVALNQQDVPVGFLSMEMPDKKNARLLLSRKLDMNDRKLRTGGNLNELEWNELNEFQFDDSKLMIEHVTGLDFNSVCGRIRRYAKLGCKVIFIDYLQKIRVNSRSHKVEEIEQGCQMIADATRDNDVHVVLLSQLNTEGEKEAPRISHLKWGGGGAEAADLILLLDHGYRRTKEAKYKLDEKGGYQIDFYAEFRDGDSFTIQTRGFLGNCKFLDWSVSANIPEEDFTI